ncbi:MAG: GTP cyclohydrolase II RibA [Rhodospirillaceae bacterium]|nr:GTP cyclohydrolase II RibA [Rhodospirillaceae bacterium]
MTATADPTLVAPGAFDRQSSLRAVERACGELRRGDPVLVRPDYGPALLAHGVEALTDGAIARMRELTGVPPALVITVQRAAALGLCGEQAGVMAIEPAELLSADLVRRISDPTEPIDAALVATLPSRSFAPTSRDGAVAVARLAKLARLLPAAVIAPVERPLATERLVARLDILSVSAFDIDHYEHHAARSLTRVADARVPLAGAPETRIIAFRPVDGGQEHLAIVIGQPEADAPVLARLHSQCFTGDLLGSLRCDCGQQLRGAIAEIARQGSGMLLYLAQEGRGIGLINKLRAYRLQDGDFDTVDANEMLGYDADERIYLPAAEMLRHLGFRTVKLMTNNPDKVEQLARFGIEVAERVPHAFPANGHNEFYLGTKRRRSGHIL